MRSDRLEKCTHGLLTRPDMAGIGTGPILPLPDTDIHPHVWDTLRAPMALWERS